jgi:glutamyl-tRNA reductase
MKKFNPESMPATTSPTVRALRTFVEKSIENELEKVLHEFDENTMDIVEKSLRSIVYSIFHNNPEVHQVAQGDMYAFDLSIKHLFNINDKTPYNVEEG